MNRFFAQMSPSKKSLVLLTIIYIGFVSLGLPDTILGVAWDFMRKEFDQPIYYAGLIATVLTVCSAVSAFFSGAILRRTGTGKLLAVCGVMTGGALLGYAFSPSFWLLLLFALPLGFGQGAVDTGMNFYVAKHYTSRDMSWLHCCWGLGASGGPLLLTLVISSGWSWRWGYAAVAIIQLLLALVFLATLSLWGESTETGRSVESFQGKVHYNLRFFCCPLMFFLYCGIEFSMGLWIFTFLNGTRGFSPAASGYAVTGYWGMLTAGRFLLGFLANRLGNQKMIRFSMVLAVIGSGLLAVPGGMILTVFSIGLIGFAFAAYYPCMMHAAPERFNDATSATVIGYQGGAGMLGAAVIPAGFGYAAAVVGFAVLPYFVCATAGLLLLLQSWVDGPVSNTEK